MKKIVLFSMLPLMTIILFVAAQNYSPTPAPAPEDIELGWPDDVMVIIERACFDCHTKDASNIKSKGALNFNKWTKYKLSKKVGKLNDISEVLKENKMPPEKYINKYPDKGLSDEEIAVIANWANKEADKLMEE
jgi:hypothetical protein